MNHLQFGSGARNIVLAGGDPAVPGVKTDVDVVTTPRSMADAPDAD